MAERRLNHFTGKEQRLILVKTERLLNHVKAIIDGTGDPVSNAVDFEVELNNLKYDYENLKRYKGGEP